MKMPEEEQERMAFSLSRAAVTGGKKAERGLPDKFFSYLF